MAYMCADSGNLMAIAQQVIQQTQKQQQQQHQSQLQTQTLTNHQNDIPTANQLHPFSHPPPPWPHHFPDTFVFPDEDDLSPLDGAVPFRLPSVTDFESDDWMESLIGDSPTGSNDFVPDTWRAPEAPLFDSSDLDRMVGVTTSSFSPAKDPATAARDSSLETTISAPILESLVEVASVVDVDPDLAAKSLIRIRDLSSEVGYPNERVASYFSEALVHRLKEKGVMINEKMGSCSSLFDFSTEDFILCYQALNDACPYFKFAHFTANQAILEATKDSDRIHIIDFGIIQGIQWAPLIQALATRPRGKPGKVRISGVPSPYLGDSPANSLIATGIRLSSFANLLDLDLEFEPILTPVHEITASTFRVEPTESVAVNFMLQLYNYLDDETPSLAERILRVARSLNPNVVTLGEYEVSLNRALFLDRFTSALNYYSAVFESTEAGFHRESADRVGVERLLFGHRILKAVGSDNGERVRMEGREKWAALMVGCGFESIPLSHYAVSQATILLRDYDYSKKYRLLDSVTGFLSLAWEERPLLTVSSWR